MLAWLVWFHALPPVVRRLIGAVLIVGTSVGCIALIVHRYGNRREAAGYNAGYNHAVVIETRKQVIIVDSLERRADSIAANAKAGDRLAVVRDSTDAKLRTHPRISRIVPLATDSLIPTVALSNLVAVYFASDSIPTPHYADVAVAKLVAWQDTAIYLTLLPQRDTAIAVAIRWRQAWSAEHDARIGADSLTALWRTRALNVVAPPKQSHAKRDMVFSVFGAAAALIARNQLSHR